MKTTEKRWEWNELPIFIIRWSIVKGNSERDTSRPKSCSVSDAIPSIRWRGTRWCYFYMGLVVTSGHNRVYKIRQKIAIFDIFEPFCSCFGILWWSEVKINHTTWFPGLDLVGKGVVQEKFHKNFCPKIKFFWSFWCGWTKLAPTWLTPPRGKTLLHTQSCKGNGVILVIRIVVNSREVPKSNFA